MNVSDETKKLMAEYIDIHGIPIMVYMISAISQEGHHVEPVIPNSKNIWEMAIKITNKNKDSKGGIPYSSKFMFYNTFLEILMVNRDDDPMEFDPKILENKDYIFNKIASVVGSRLSLVLGMLDGKTAQEVFDEKPHRFERINIKEVDALKRKESF